MKGRHAVVSAAAGVLAAASALTIAPAASADSPITWNQSVGRASVDAPCPATSSQDAAAGWTPWSPSWEQWANGGTGGPVCTRSNTWAYASDGDGTAPPRYPSAGCVEARAGKWAQFNGGWALAFLSPAYNDSTCTPPTDTVFGFKSVYAPPGYDADALCLEAWGTHVNELDGNYVWACR